MGDAQWDKLTDEMSLECLMKDNGTLPNSTEHSVCSAKEGGGASMVVYNGKLTFTIHTDGGYRQAQATITAGKWYHAIGTWDGDTARLYVDGQLAASIDAPGPLKRPANLGRDHFFAGADASSTTAGQFFSPVSVAKMGLYSRALSATEIAAIHNGARTAEGAAARRSVAQAMCWDREGELVKTLTAGETCEAGVVDELGEAEYVYTGSGERVIRADAEAVTIYLPGGQEVTIPRDETRNVSAHRYYTFNGETIAVRDQRGLGGVTSLVNDHHGTPIVAIPNTTWTPASVRKQYADPFGATRGKNATATASVGDRDGNGTPGDRGFLGKSEDTTGLNQVGARYYDQETGAFISPDPLLDPAKAQHLNAYSYSSQNPATLSDPSGLMQLDHLGGGGGGASAYVGLYYSRASTNWLGRLLGLVSKVKVPTTMVGKDLAAASRAQAAAARAQATAERAQVAARAAAQAAARAKAAEAARINAAREAAAISRANARYARQKRDRDDDQLDVLFGQRRVGPNFSPGGAFSGRSVFEVAEDIKSGELDVSDVRLEVFRYQGQLVTINNRSLTALSLAGKRPTNIIVRVPTKGELARLREKPIVGGPLPSPVTAITPSQKDLTILQVVHVK